MIYGVEKFGKMFKKVFILEFSREK